MSVSSHLTPDPERRLRVIYENIYNSLNRANRKLGAITLFAAVQMTVVKFVAPEGAMGYLALLILCAILPIGILGVSPFIETPKPLPLLKPEDKPHPGDSLIDEYDIVRYSQIELTNFLDRYLGGGITATPYYVDIVAQIVIGARIATRKRRLFKGACVLAWVAQLCLFIQLLLR